MKVIAKTRANEGSSASRRLRRAGSVPGIVYGQPGAPVSIEIEHNPLFHSLRVEAFHSSVLDLELDGQVQPVLLRAVQWHPYKQQVLHVDFQRVDANRKVHLKVPLHFVNGETSPAVKLGGAIIGHVVTEIEVECLPGQLPEFLTVDLANLEAGKSVHLNDIALPAGVTPVLHGQDNPVIATAPVPAGAASAAAEGEQK